MGYLGQEQYVIQVPEGEPTQQPLFEPEKQEKSVTPERERELVPAGE